MNENKIPESWPIKTLVWVVISIFILAIVLVPFAVALAVTDSDTGHLPGNSICADGNYPYINPQNPTANQSVTLRARALQGELTSVVIWYTTNASASVQGEWSSISASDEADLNCNSTTYDSWIATIPAQIRTVYYKIAYTDATETKWQTSSGEPATLSTSTTWTTGSTSLSYSPPNTVNVDDTYDATSCTTDGYTYGYDCFDSIQAGIDAVAASGFVEVAAGTYTENVDQDKTAVVVNVNGEITLDGYLNISTGYFYPPFTTMYLKGDFTSTVPPNQGGFRGNVGGLLVMNGTNAQSMNGNGVVTRFNSLAFDNSNGVTVNHSQQIGDQMILTDGIVSLTSYDIQFRPYAVITGTYGTSSMITTPGAGRVCRVAHPTGAVEHLPFTWPLGDTSGTTDYTPLTLRFTQHNGAGNHADPNDDGSFYWDSGICIRVVDDKHPNLGSQSYLTRYWDVTYTAVNTFTARADFSYVQDDVVGVESDILAQKYDGADLRAGDPVDTVLNTGVVTFTNTLGDFTGTSIPTAVTMGAFDTYPRSGSILLVWDTVLELNHLGFHVFRSTSLDGERQRINSELITPTQLGTQGNHYEFQDQSAQVGETYYYWLQSVNTYGGTEWFGPRSSTWFFEVYLPSVSR